MIFWTSIVAVCGAGQVCSLVCVYALGIGRGTTALIGESILQKLDSGPGCLHLHPSPCSNSQTTEARIHFPNTCKSALPQILRITSDSAPDRLEKAPKSS